MTQQELRLVKSRQENIGNAIITVASCLVVYYSLRPGDLEVHRQAVRKLWRQFVHRVSVWQTLAAIHALPETPERAS